jgi:hypothetical protein
VQHATCFFLNGTAFGGLCRLNARGEFTVPFGGADHGFAPLLVRHEAIRRVLLGLGVSNRVGLDLRETNSHNAIPHVHSLSRLVASKGSPMIHSTKEGR